MVATKLLQVKLDPALKSDLEEVSRYKGIPVTSFVKLTLTAATRREKKQMYTENGLTGEEESEILRRGQEMERSYQKGNVRTLSGEELIRELNE